MDKKITKAKGVKKLPLTVYIWRVTLERLTASQAGRVFIYTRLHGYVSQNWIWFPGSWILDRFASFTI